MDNLVSYMRDTLVMAAREVYQPVQPVATCPECRCDLYLEDGPCGEAGCPVISTSTTKAAA